MADAEEFVGEVVIKVKEPADSMPAFKEMASIFEGLSELMSLSTKLLERGFEISFVDFDELSAPGTAVCGLVLKPTAELLAFSAALRALNADTCSRVERVIKDHEKPSCDDAVGE